MSTRFVRRDNPWFWVLAVLGLLALIGLVFLVTRPAPAAPPPAPDDSSSVIVDAPDCGNGPNFSLAPRQTAFVRANCRVSGDVSVAKDEKGIYLALYDNSATNGLVVDMLSDGWIYAEWGASVNSDTPDQWVANMKRAGCEDGKGCDTVSVVTWQVVDP